MIPLLIELLLSNCNLDSSSHKLHKYYLHCSQLRGLHDFFLNTPWNQFDHYAHFKMRNWVFFCLCWLIKMAFNFGSFLEMQVLTFLRAFLVFFFSLKKACKWESTIPLCLAAHHCMTSPRFSGLPVTSRWEAADKDSLGFPSALNIADFPGPHEKLLGLTSYSLRCCCLVGLRTGLLRLQAWTFLSAQLDSDRSQSPEKSSWHFPGR